MKNSLCPLSKAFNSAAQERWEAIDRMRTNLALAKVLLDHWAKNHPDDYLSKITKGFSDNL